jgi:hypothetical protein
MRTHSPAWALAFASATLVLGCGSKSNNFGGSSGTGSNTGLGLDAGPSTDEMGAETDATVLNADPDAQRFVATSTDDASSVVTQSVCTAGVYQGEFTTYVGVGGDGGNAGIFSLMWNGSLTIDLDAQKITMTSTTGGEIPTIRSTTTLEIADGGALDGSDTMGGSFFANLNGKLDCSPDAGPPYHLTATLSNGDYKQRFFKLAMIGNLTADYMEAGATTPAMLANGEILVGGVLKDGGAPFASARGTWSATWVSPAPP